MLDAGCCMLHVACCIAHVACCMLDVGCWMLHSACRMYVCHMYVSIRMPHVCCFSNIRMPHPLCHSYATSTSLFVCHLYFGIHLPHLGLWVAFSGQLISIHPTSKSVSEDTSAKDADMQSLHQLQHISLNLNSFPELIRLLELELEMIR